METLNNRSERLLQYLALDGLAARLKGLTVPGDALTWSRFCGSLSLVLVLLLFLSGAFMAFYYSPVPDAAYDSVDHAQFEIPFGDVVRGIHHYAWNLLLVVMGLHLGRAFLFGAYKAPRQLIWLSGLIILLFVPAFLITGDLLPWDQKGYWTTQVRTSIISSVPLAGDLAVRLLQGGPRTGIVALTRFYVLHVIFLPGALILLLVVHFHFIAKRGLSGPLSGDETRRRQVPFITTIIGRWLMLFILIAIILGLFSHYWPAPLGDPADPTDSSFVPKPEWWVLFLNQLVGIFRGPWSIIGTVLIPGGLAGLLLILPFLDRSPERNPLHRKKTLLAGLIIAAILLALSVMGYFEHYSAPHV